MPSDAEEGETLNRSVPKKISKGKEKKMGNDVLKISCTISLGINRDRERGKRTSRIISTM